MAENHSQQTSQSASPELLAQVGELIVHALNLDISAEEIAPDDPLYGEGLGLDSIDILEVALVVSKNFGIQLRADSEDNQRIFKSLRSLSDYIATHRTQ
ncbi:MAG: phosphopantetheine-binding protein [Burkholderiaceae bacterium]